MITTLYLVRHGEVYNPEGILYGRLPNFGLSDRGKTELTKTAEFLKDTDISHIYSSPLKRAMESAGIIKERLNLPEICITEEIIEVETSYQGQKFADLDALQSEVYLKPLSPSDETIEQIAERMKHFLKEILENHTGQTTVAVSHGDPLVILKTIIQKKQLTFETFKTNDYSQHGEVYEFIAENNDLSVKSVFKP
ncbi:MAG TPA: histidine phosphatase family protein [Candidatus Saccharimonadales bacterium]|nr:histidine phosphatase family protein [Candidatus Saccharimonadales bacterium]